MLERSKEFDKKREIEKQEEIRLDDVEASDPNLGVKDNSSRKKQGFRAPISNWIQKDPKYFTDSIFEFNENLELFNSKKLQNTLKQSNIQKIWYLYNLSSWHLSRVK